MSALLRPPAMASSTSLDDDLRTRRCPYPRGPSESESFLAGWPLPFCPAESQAMRPTLTLPPSLSLMVLFLLMAPKKRPGSLFRDPVLSSSSDDVLLHEPNQPPFCEPTEEERAADEPPSEPSYWPPPGEEGTRPPEMDILLVASSNAHATSSTILFFWL